MSHAQFDWRRVLAVLWRADLSDAIDERGFRKEDPQPCWPSEPYRDGFYWLRRQLLAAPRKRPITAADVASVADKLFAELARATPPDPVAAQRWEEAAEALQKAKRIARDTTRDPERWP